MASPTRSRARRQNLQLMELDGIQSVHTFNKWAMRKRKRLHTIEDSCNDPHVFCAPHRRVLQLVSFI